MFFVHNGRRVTRGLGTDDEGKAKSIALGLERLWREGIRDVLVVPEGIDPAAIRLFFERKAVDIATIAPSPFPTDEEFANEILAALPDVKNEVARLAPDFDLIQLMRLAVAAAREKLKPLALNAARLDRENQLKDGLISEITRQRDEARAELAALKGSVLGQAVSAHARAPRLREATVEFWKRISAKNSPKDVQQVMRMVNLFCNWLERKREPGKIIVTTIRAQEVNGFLDEWGKLGDQTKKLARRDAAIRRIGSFLNFCATTWEFPSVMLKVEKPSQGQVARERAGIHWHEEREVAAVLKGCGDSYWRALIGTLVYAGLQLEELIYLRRADVVLDKPKGKRVGGRINIQSVKCPVSGDMHFLKRANRTRSIDIEPVKLGPLLAAWAKELPDDSFWFFPRPVTDEHARGRKVSDGQRWRGDNLSATLIGHAGGKDAKKRGPRSGILPVGMTAMSLRRTFGSLLIRKGRSAGEVAAVLGNTEAVVQRHYAKILPSEVKVRL